MIKRLFLRICRSWKSSRPWSDVMPVMMWRQQNATSMCLLCLVCTHTFSASIQLRLSDAWTWISRRCLGYAAFQNTIYLHVEFTLKTDQAVVLPVRIGGSDVWYFVPDHDQRQPREVSPLKLRALILMLVYGLIGHRAMVYTHRRASSLLTLDLLSSLW